MAYHDPRVSSPQGASLYVEHTPHSTEHHRHNAITLTVHRLDDGSLGNVWYCRNGIWSHAGCIASRFWPDQSPQLFMLEELFVDLVKNLEDKLSDAPKSTRITTRIRLTLLHRYIQRLYAQTPI